MNFELTTEIINEFRKPDAEPDEVIKRSWLRGSHMFSKICWRSKPKRSLRIPCMLAACILINWKMRK